MKAENHREVSWWVSFDVHDGGRIDRNDNKSIFEAFPQDFGPPPSSTANQLSSIAFFFLSDELSDDVEVNNNRNVASDGHRHGYSVENNESTDSSYKTYNNFHSNTRESNYHDNKNYEMHKKHRWVSQPSTAYGNSFITGFDLSLEMD